MNMVTPRFVARDAPLAPIGVGARGAAAKALAVRLLHDTALPPLRGVGSADVLVFLGETEALPWVDGAFYLGRDPAAPQLLLPTQARPNVPLDAFERALLRRPDVVAPIAVVPGSLISVADARALDPDRLRRWLEANR